jgi:hypothetical protein
MDGEFPGAVPEIPVTNIDRAVDYDRRMLGFTLDFGDEAGGIAGISQGHCRMFLTNPGFREGPRAA